VDLLTPDEQTRLATFIRDKHGFDLTLGRFTEVTFDLFEDISGMEGPSTPEAIEIINSMWSIYCAKKLGLTKKTNATK
jgi:hypothetical protein